MEIFTSIIQIIILDSLILMEVFLIFKHYFMFKKEVTHPDRQIARNRAYNFMVLASEPIEFFGSLKLIYYMERGIVNYFFGGISIFVFLGVLFFSMIYREKHIVRIVKNDINRLEFPYTAAARDCTKALFVGTLVNLISQTYIYLFRISRIASLIVLVLSVLAFIIVIPKIFRFVKNRPFPELNANRKFKWLD